MTSTGQTPAAKLIDAIDTAELPLVVPGAANALTAILVHEAGFRAGYVTGAGVSNTYLGLPDLGLLTQDELVDHVAAMTEAVDLPLIVDADTGFGNALNVRRVVRRLERAGAAAVQLEDQVSPKRCGHFSGKQLVSADEMIGKIRSALDTRTDTLVVARTDAIGVLGLDEACDRAAAYAESGADLVFVESPTSRRQMAEIARRVPGRHIANMVEGGRTPRLSQRELAKLGYAVALYANSALRGAVFGARRVLNHLATHGDTVAADDLLISWDDRQALVGKERFEALAQRYVRTGEA